VRGARREARGTESGELVAGSWERAAGSRQPGAGSWQLVTDMAISRRNALKTLGSAAAVPVFRLKADATSVESVGVGLPPSREALDAAILAAIAEVVLPSEADRPAAIAAFTRWIADYQEAADTDHGYGNTRIRSTGPSPARKYAAQIAALDEAARAAGAAGFARATLDARRAIVAAAIADAKVERLPARPTGAHIASDLMGHYFGSSVAADLCYRAAIGRDACRGLPGSEKPPAKLDGPSRVGARASRATLPSPRASRPAPRKARPEGRDVDVASRPSKPAPRS
jgi:hypothetical protein